MQPSCFSLRLWVVMAVVFQLSADRGLAGLRVIERPKAILSYWDFIPPEMAPQLRGNEAHPLSFRTEEGLRIPVISGDGTTVMGSLEGPAGSQPALWRGTNISLLPMAGGTTVGFAVGSDFNAKRFWGNFIVDPYPGCPGPAYTICCWDTNGVLFYLGSNTTALCTAVSAD